MVEYIKKPMMGIEIEFFSKDDDIIAEASEIFPLSPDIEIHREFLPVSGLVKFYEIKTQPTPIENFDEIKERYTDFMELLKELDIYSVHINYSDEKLDGTLDNLCLILGIFAPEYMSFYSSKRLTNDTLGWIEVENKKIPEDELYCVSKRNPSTSRSSKCLELRFPCYSDINPIDILEYGIKNIHQVKDSDFYFPELTVLNITEDVSFEEKVERNLFWWKWLPRYSLYSRLRREVSLYIISNYQDIVDRFLSIKEKFLEKFLKKEKYYKAKYLSTIKASVKVSNWLSKKTISDIKEIIC